VRDISSRDPRVRLVNASPVPDSWTGKAWGLHFGLENSDPGCQWILCVDADVHAAQVLARSLLAHARRMNVAVFSIAARQHVSGKVDALFHPAMLTTLIYRYGIPGRATRNPARVQANGQCFFAQRATLLATQAFRAAGGSLCEDVTVARHIAARGIPVGFYEGAGLVQTSMYSTWRDTWRNWPRSLPMRDQYFGWSGALGLIEVLLIQALPLPLFLVSLYLGAGSWMIEINGVLVLVRLGVLVGVCHSYDRLPWSYWLSPALDLPVAIKILESALRRTHTWRGRSYIRDKDNRFRLLRATK
jgi:dolichol-phosphate mannosyltransferase